ncbi:MAG TPA: c-type cytochrome [Hyphomicrobiaceae bacterium]|nr:c-type cytochrome [Hyphomicrobiaceae bacterium]
MAEHGRSRRLRAASLAIAAALSAIAAIQPAAAQSMAERLQQCGTCHGEDGNSKMEKTPSLAGQPELFLANQLILMRDKLRKSEIMEPFIKGLSDPDVIALAAHYARLPPAPSPEPIDSELAAHGESLAQKLFCASCHLPTYAGREQMPRLAPQRIDYLIESLTAYRDGRRSGIDTSMNAVMYGTTDRDIRALAHYLATIR